MKVSIITSCYNREHTIRGCIESVLAQDYPDIEYIIIDGASTDHSADVIREAISGHERRVPLVRAIFGLIFKEKEEQVMKEEAEYLEGGEARK